ncbi:tRNA synthetases class I-domain-containing protein [Ochromonadaceae sp. CCMP2298]|nr:tRNA synthetases class I-domain-containing protein [Ochromonadaceae sp. CCMP2298]
MAHLKGNAFLRLIIVATMLFSVSALLRPRSSSLRAIAQRRAPLPSQLRPLSSPAPRHASRLFDTAKPDFTQEGSSKYFDFQRLEGNIYGWWEAQGYFKPDESSTKEPFVIPMPPPNVTGYLHMGHAIFVALQDIMARFQRMRGRPTLWLPGTDHAGIATQLLVERQLTAEGISRKDLGREAFLQRVWEWKREKGGYITQQMRRLGASADWSREKFTLDEDMSSAVTEAFLRLHASGLIYRGDYLVNWSPNLQTAVSDLEVEYSEEQGTLYFFKYALEGSETDFIPVATTRPETILGDTAVCVHPEDPRYASFVGKMVRVPTTDRLIPVIADDYVDREFGTGALKITPAHDPNDYEIGKRYNLPLISIMNKDASINHHGGDRYQGLSREQCREKLWQDLEASGVAIKTQPHTQRVPRSQRGGEVIEPMVSAQWFVRTEGMGAKAVEAVRSGDIKIIPERFEKVWYNWLENIHDWCISRQLWWGHRIPVYYVSGGSSVAGEGAAAPYVVARSEAEALQLARQQYGDAASVVQDEDVLDTWFSSGLWPFSTVGWPQQEGQAAADFLKYYPAAVLETGYDILFFWVARMAMMGLELTGKAPFHTVYLHGLVRDAQGRKMSKTTGNVIDPLDTIEQLGADALRYSLVTGSTPGQDVPLSMEKIESNRNFANKLWNAGKFVGNCLTGVAGDERKLAELVVRGPLSAEELAALPLPERFIVSKCHLLVAGVTEGLEAHNFGEAGRQIYEFLWDEFADWYIEASKARMRGDSEQALAEQQQTRRVLVYVWDTCMRLLHPFMPYLTETLWQQIPHQGDSIMVAPWPQEGNSPLAVDAEAVRTFESLQALVRSIRNARAEYNVDPGKKLAVVLKVKSEPVRRLLQQERLMFALLARADEGALMLVEDEADMEVAAAGPCVHLIVEEGVEAFLPQSGLIDTVKEQARLGKQGEKLTKDIEVLQKRLGSQGFVDRAPPELVLEVRGKLSEMQEQLKTVQASVDALVA